MSSRPSTSSGPSIRERRVADAIRGSVANYLLFETNSPALQQATITIVKMSKDLSLAKVYFSQIDTTTVQTTLDALQSEMGAIKRKLSQDVTLRYMPKLTFHYDDSMEYGQRITSLLKDSE